MWLCQLYYNGSTFVCVCATTTAEVDTTDEPLAEGELEARTQMMVALRKKLDEDVKKNVAAAQERQKKHYDARHQQGDYKVPTCNIHA